MSGNRVAFFVVALVLLAPGLCFLSFGIGMNGGTFIGVALCGVAVYLFYRAFFSRADG